MIFVNETKREWNVKDYKGDDDDYNEHSFLICYDTHQHQQQGLI